MYGIYTYIIINISIIYKYIYKYVNIHKVIISVPGKMEKKNIFIKYLESQNYEEGLIYVMIYSEEWVILTFIF